MTTPAHAAEPRGGLPVLGPLSPFGRTAIIVTVLLAVATIVLDFILYGAGIVPKGFDIPTVPLSDHLPLVFDFEVDREFARASDSSASEKA